MASIIVKLFFSLTLFSSLFSISSSSSSSSSSIDFWCNQTPHPEPCKFHMSHTHDRFRPPNHPSEFKKMLVRSSLVEAQAMHKEAQDYGPKFVTKMQKYVFSDCLKLYDNTIFHLNRTLRALHATSCSLSDAQTWLSAALTNIESCRSGALQLGVGELIAQSNVSDNVRKMISNVLAVNGKYLKQDNNTEEEIKAHGFPSWSSRHDRRLLSLKPSSVKANLVVAQDGTGHLKTVQAAIDVASRRKVKTRFVIRVKKGIYNENIAVDKDNENLMIIGDGMRLTIITGSKSVKDGITPSVSATAGIDGAHFIARDITFRNTAGPEKGQAVALRSASDLSVFYRCSIEGYQDTLMADSQRQFYRDCRIFGTVDFVWGNAAAVFQNCRILVRRPLQGQANMITAQGRGDPFQNTGISIINSRIQAAPDFRRVYHSFETYLGRPWQQYARVVVMKTYIEGLVNPLGWSPWDASGFGQDTCYFGEYMNNGAGSSTTSRVNWPGFHVISNPNEANQFSVASFLAGRTWLPSTGVPFSVGVN